MDYEKLYLEQRARAEKAEKRVKQLEGDAKAATDKAKASAENTALHVALLGAGATKKAAKAAIDVLRRTATGLDFNEDGGLAFAQFNGRVFSNADELAKAFIGEWPNFTQAHEDAVSRARGVTGAPADFDKMSAIDLAVLGLSQRDDGGGAAPDGAPAKDAPAARQAPSLADQIGAALDKRGQS